MRASIPEPLASVLDDAVRRGRRIPIWWRDDDAVRDTPALERLFAVARHHDAPVAIAAIPGHIEGSLERRIAREPLASVLVHGFHHANHAPVDEKPAEFGGHRPVAVMVEDIVRAKSLARSAFGSRTLDILVPPWNRIAPALVARLPESGFVGLSAFGRLDPYGKAARLSILNTHLDPVAWRGSRSLASPDQLAGSLRAALPEWDAYDTGAVGLLSHHLAFDAELWSFWTRLLAALARHPGARLVGPEDLLRERAASSTCTSPVALRYGGPRGERFG